MFRTEQASHRLAVVLRRRLMALLLSLLAPVYATADRFDIISFEARAADAPRAVRWATSSRCGSTSSSERRLAERQVSQSSACAKGSRLLAMSAHASLVLEALNAGLRRTSSESPL
jgi:hypothetical protein